MKGRKMLVVLVLLQLAFSATYSEKLPCGTYYLSKGNSVLYVERGGWLAMSPGNSEKVTKLTVERKCLLFADGEVYAPNNNEAAYIVNKKLRHIQCCCELWNTPYERFLNRHVINGLPGECSTWNDDMKARCIPIRGRVTHTFLITKAADVQKVCGTENEEEHICRSENQFSYVNIEQKADGHYTNNYKQDKAYLVVTCANLLPIHFNQMTEDPNLHGTCV